MLEESFRGIYKKFQLNFYKKIFGRFETREATLTTVESYCVDIIHAMGRPTINEFASFINISSPNAAYKVAGLIKKGYVKKERSKDDKREYFIQVTDKYMEYFNLSNIYVSTVIQRINERFSQQELEVVDRVLRITYEELMPEIELKIKNLDDDFEDLEKNIQNFKEDTLS